MHASEPRASPGCGSPRRAWDTIRFKYLFAIRRAAARLDRPGLERASARTCLASTRSPRPCAQLRGPLPVLLCVGVPRLLVRSVLVDVRALLGGE